MINKTKKRIFQSEVIFASLGNIQSRSQFGGYSLSADRIMFALVSEGELYLRATLENEEIFCQLEMTPLIYRKRGIDIVLRYFQVHESLWADPEKLLHLATLSLQGMHNDKTIRKNGGKRLKDLPNINLSMERLLWQVGIKNSLELRTEGSQNAYLKLCSIKKNMGLHILFALEGAILGFHKEALPASSRNALTQWFNAYQKGRCAANH